MVELSNPVKYHLCQNLPLPPLSWLYDYVIAADGVYKRAENDHMAACIPVMELNKRAAKSGIAGLSRCTLPDFHLKRGKIPLSALANIMADARTSLQDQGRFIENYYIINQNGTAMRPEQSGTHGMVSYRLSRASAENSHTFLMDIHTHPAEAFFSKTDNADEQGFRMYGVLGHIEREKPDFRLRLGVYGDFMTLRPNEAFEGNIDELVEWEAWI